MNKCFSNKKSFQKGDILLSEEPFAFVLKSKFHKERCDHCFKRTQLLKCSGCSFVYYCDRFCQKNSWIIHKHECHNIKRVSPRVVPDAVRMLSRVIIKLNKGGINEKTYYTDTKFRTFRDLMSHYNDVKKDEKRMEHFATIKTVLDEYLQDQLIPNASELLVIYGKMVINSFNILDPEMQSIGTGLYLGASVIDHSCSANAVAVFENTKIYIRTLKDLSTLNWMKVYICYIELLNLPSIRQEELQSLYYFLCECPRCTDINELKSMTGTFCQNDQCNACIPGGALGETSVCSNCNQPITEEAKNLIAEITQFTQAQLEKMVDLAYLDICKVCLEKQKKILHPMNIYCVKILDLAMESCIAMENWESAFDYGLQLEKPFRKYYGELHPIMGIFLMKLGKISLLLSNFTKAKLCFNEAAKILLVTHGSTHTLIKEQLHQYMSQCQ